MVGIDFRRQALAHHLAMPVMFEAIDHHALESREMRHERRHLLVERLRGLRASQVLKHPLKPAVKILHGEIGRLLELREKQPLTSVEQNVVALPRDHDAKRRQRCGITLRAKRGDRTSGLRLDARQRFSEKLAEIHRAKLAGVRARMQHPQRRLFERKQHAMRLNRAGNVDRLPAAAFQRLLGRGNHVAFSSVSQAASVEKVSFAPRTTSSPFPSWRSSAMQNSFHFSPVFGP